MIESAVERTHNQSFESFCGRTLIDPAGHNCFRERVGQSDRLRARPQRQGAGEKTDNDPRKNLLNGNSGLHGLVDHDDDSGDQDQHAVAGQHDLPGGIPQLADPRQLIQRWGGQQGVSQQIQQVVQRRGDEIPKESFDRLIDAGGDIGDPAGGLLRIVAIAGLARLLTRLRCGRGGLRDTAWPLARFRLIRLWRLVICRRWVGLAHRQW